MVYVNTHMQMLDCRTHKKTFNANSFSAQAHAR